MVGTMNAKTAARFEKSRAAWLAAADAWSNLQFRMEYKYGTGYRTYMTSGERAKLDALSARQSKHADAMFDMLDEVSAINWRSGFSYVWVLRKLSFADAVAGTVPADAVRV